MVSNKQYCIYLYINMNMSIHQYAYFIILLIIYSTAYSTNMPHSKNGMNHPTVSWKKWKWNRMKTLARQHLTSKILKQQKSQGSISSSRVKWLPVRKSQACASKAKGGNLCDSVSQLSRGTYLEYVASLKWHLFEGSPLLLVVWLYNLERGPLHAKRTLPR